MKLSASVIKYDRSLAMRFLIFIGIAALLVWYCFQPYLEYRRGKK